MEIINRNEIFVIGYLNRAKDQRYLIKFEKQNHSSTPPTATLFTNEPIEPKLKQKFLDVIEKCSDFKDLLRQSTTDEGETYETEFIDAVLSEIENVGLERLTYLSDDFTTVHFRYTDQSGRQHILKVTMDVWLPLIVNNLEVDLPEKIEFDDSASLNQLFEIFVDTVDSLQDFWSQLELLDENELISKNDDDVDRNVCIKLTFNPKHPKALPEFSLAGDSSAIVSYKTLIDSKVDDWNEENDIFENLRQLFGTNALCAGPTQRRNVVESHCGVCYNYESNKNEIPDQNCLQCKQQFHRSCLYEWLRKQANQRLSFGTVFGPCPYCSQTVKVKLATC